MKSYLVCKFSNRNIKLHRYNKKLVMKISPILCFFIFFFSISINAQDQTKPTSRQIGITGLPIIYLNNGGGLNGFALYGNIGWFIKNSNVVGIRPFFGAVDPGFDNFRRLSSLGSNVYYRRL